MFCGRRWSQNSKSPPFVMIVVVRNGLFCQVLFSTCLPPYPAPIFQRFLILYSSLTRSNTCWTTAVEFSGAYAKYDASTPSLDVNRYCNSVHGMSQRALCAAGPRLCPYNSSPIAVMRLLL